MMEQERRWAYQKELDKMRKTKEGEIILNRKVTWMEIYLEFRVLYGDVYESAIKWRPSNVAEITVDVGEDGFVVYNFDTKKVRQVDKYI